LLLDKNKEMHPSKLEGFTDGQPRSMKEWR